MTPQEAIQSLKSGSDYIYRKYFGVVAEYVIKNSGNYEDAEDLFDEAILALLEKKTLPENITFNTLFTSIWHNLWLKELRRRKTAKKVQVEVYVTDYDEQICSLILDECINELHNRYRTVIEGYINGVKYKDMAIKYPQQAKCKALKRMIRTARMCEQRINEKLMYNRFFDAETSSCACAEKL